MKPARKRARPEPPKPIELPVVREPGGETDQRWIELILQHTKETGRTALFLYEGRVFSIRLR